METRIGKTSLCSNTRSGNEASHASVQAEEPGDFFFLDLPDPKITQCNQRHGVLQMARAELQNGDERTWTKCVALNRSEAVGGQVSAILSLSDPKMFLCFLSSPSKLGWCPV